MYYLSKSFSKKVREVEASKVNRKWVFENMKIILEFSFGVLLVKCEIVRHFLLFAYKLFMHESKSVDIQSEGFFIESVVEVVGYVCFFLHPTLFLLVEVKLEYLWQFKL